jgi:predicted component of type VI protein secretion system
MAKLIYAATNPVKDHLVDRVHHWPGVNGLSALLNDRPLSASRPRHFFRSNGGLPRRAALRLVIPSELGDADAFRRTLRECVAAFEQRIAADRLRTGRRIVGRRGVENQSWRQQPTSEEARVVGRPRIAARSVWSRIEALLRNRAFVAAYRTARLRWRAGLEAVFPIGTYWLRRFANVPVAAPP